ncbi:MAG: hypothetical protein WBD58_16000 [Geitlerinemataceae cyanobacterium]
MHVIWNYDSVSLDKKIFGLDWSGSFLALATTLITPSLEVLYCYLT